MHRSLIVARMKQDAAPGIASIFEESDRGELPDLIGVTGRSLFQFGEVYLHLIEADRPPGPEVAPLAGHPEFRPISERLSEYVQAYDPEAMKVEVPYWE